MRKAIAICFLSVILVLQAKKRNRQITQRETFKQALEAAKTPYSKLLAQRSVYRDSVYQVYIAKINGQQQLIFMCKGELRPVQKESKFFVHLYPKDKNELKGKANHNSYNFENRPKQFMVGNEIYFYSTMQLPDFEIEKMNLGQYGFQGNNEINWRIKALLIGTDIAEILDQNDEAMAIFKLVEDNF